MDMPPKKHVVYGHSKRAALHINMCFSFICSNHKKLRDCSLHWVTLVLNAVLNSLLLHKKGSTWHIKQLTSGEVPDKMVNLCLKQFGTLSSAGPSPYERYSNLNLILMPGEERESQKKVSHFKRDANITYQ